MDKQTKLRDVVARLCRGTPEEVGADFSLVRFLSGSINVHLLESAVRQHLGIVSPPLHGLRTYAELEAAVLGTTAAPAGNAALATGRPPAAGATNPTTSADVACGLDVESVSKLPVATDYWTHDFYVNTFSSVEIAYCTRQVEPRSHFAARWCAKEALKKCDAAFLAEPLVNIQVHHDESGAPVLQLVRTQQVLPYAVSLTHSDDTAAAVVVRCRPAAAPGSAETVTAPHDNPPPRQESARGVFVAYAVAALSALLSFVALWRTCGF
jgi:phosphopantetheine--protein transferase-like protein